MTVESVQERIRLIRRLVEGARSFNINEIPLPASGRKLTLSAAQKARAWGEFIPGAARRYSGQHYYNLYVHIPFCRSRCTFCIYDSARHKSRGRADDYIDFLAAQAGYFSKTFDGEAFQNVHIGGGTPSILEEDQLRTLFDALFGAFAFDKMASKVIECNPDSVTAGKAGLMRAYGFNKISMGVQSLNADVLRGTGRRYQTRGSVMKAIEILDKEGVASINCDLMVGLAGDSGPSFMKSLKELMEMGPSTIMLTKVQPPGHYLKKHWGGSYRRYIEFFDGEFTGAVREMFELASDFGYGVDNPCVNELGWRFWKKGFVPSYDTARPYYCTGGEAPSSCLGIGSSSKSRIFGSMMIEQRKGGDGPSFHENEPLYRADTIDERYEIWRHIFSQISKNRSVSKPRFEALCGDAIENLYGYVLDELAGLGVVEMDGSGDEIRFTPEGTRDLFVYSRLFLDRPTLISSLAHADRAELRVQAGDQALTLRIEHIREGETYAGKEGDLGLVLKPSGKSAGDPAVRDLARKIIEGAFRKIAQGRPWVSALEVADQLKEKAGVMGRALPAGIELKIEVCSILTLQPGRIELALLKGRHG
ncbi:MAG: radical SAM protein [Pseudomonadota bacterium]